MFNIIGGAQEAAGFVDGEEACDPGHAGSDRLQQVLARKCVRPVSN